MVLWLTQDDLRPLLDDPRAIDEAFTSIEAAFAEYQRGEAKVYAPVPLPLSGPQRAIRVSLGASPSYGAVLRTYPVVGRGGHDSNVNLLFDGESGQLLSVMAADDVNAFRTSAPAGAACRRLAPAQPRVMGMLGSGHQARGHAHIIRYALPSVEEIRVFSPTPAHRAAFADEMSTRLQMPVRAVDDPHAAVAEADVIGVVSNSREPVLDAEWVRPGTLVFSLASGQLPAELIRRARVIVSARQEVVTRREPYASMAAAGAWDPESIGEFGDVVLGKIPGRTRPDEIVVYEMPGMSIWDTAIVAWVYRWAVAHEVGNAIELSTR